MSKVVNLSAYRKPKPAHRVPRRSLEIEHFLLINIAVIGTIVVLIVWDKFF